MPAKQTTDFPNCDMVLGSTKSPDSFVHIWENARHFVAKCFRVGPFSHKCIEPLIFDGFQKQNMQKKLDVLRPKG